MNKTKIKIKRKLKRLFFKFKLHLFVPINTFNFLAHISSLSRWVNNREHQNQSDFYLPTFDYSKRFKLFEEIISSENLNTNIDYLEFGVAKGHSIRWWLKNIDNPNAKFFGFDTFTGLPEDWGQFKKGDMNNSNEPPRINDGRCSFYQGLFQQTLPDFMEKLVSNKRKVIHMDADLYSSTLFVLTSLSPMLKPGDILFFDEFNVPMHEYKAFMDWVKSYYINYEVIGSVNNFYQTAIKIL